MEDIIIIKKDSTIEEFDKGKIFDAIKKSAHRTLCKVSDIDFNKILLIIEKEIYKTNIKEIPVSTMHLIVEKALDTSYPLISKSYKEYRNYKTDFVRILDSVYKKNQAIMHIGDKENSNSDSALVSTQRSLAFNNLNKELYKKFFLNNAELQAINEGYIYIHDMSARRNSPNCCLFNMETVLKDGFEMGNVFYNEPKSLDTAFDVIGDITLSAASQIYGGFTIPSVDLLLEKYAEKSYNKYFLKYLKLGLNKQLSHKTSIIDVERDFEQGFQGWEYKFNTVASSRGDYPFISITFGTGVSKFAKMASMAILKVRKNGQGKDGFKKPVLFPKLIFLYDENLHGEGKILEDIFNASIECSRKTMYPDYLSLTGEGYVPDIYKKYGEIVHIMGCRATLSPYYNNGGLNPLSNDDKPIFVGRFNVGAVSLHLPMIYAKSQEENKNFYEILDYYLELIRNLHLRTYDYLGDMKASTNPLAFCEGGFYGGHLKYNEKIKPLLQSATASFGITALNELQQLYNNKSLVQDSSFALETMKYINKKVEVFKEEDNRLYAVYGTPAESLCGLQVEQFRKKYGIIKNVSDKEYMSNSFHCHVTEDITPIQKQDYECKFWNFFNGGKIQYVKYPINYNIDAIKTLIRRAMKLGLYEGVNLSLSYCNQCGHQELKMSICPKCNSNDLTCIDRMNGYLSYSRVKKDSMLNQAKLSEILERKSM